MSSLTAIGTPSSGRLVPAGPAARVSLVGLQARAFGEHDAKRVQARVQTRDPLEIDVDQLARGDLARGDQLRLAGDPGVGELGGVHRRAIY